MADPSPRLGIPSLRRPINHTSRPSTAELDPDLDESGEGHNAPPSTKPSLLHRFHHDGSILVVTVKNDTLYAGTQNGELLVYDLHTFQRKRIVQAHDSSILGLCLPSYGQILLSSAGDRFVNVWNPASLELICSIYSLYDIGDIFCVSWSPCLESIYFGAQNTSIQWFDLSTVQPAPTASSNHPSVREDRFFDSSGPGGVRTPRQDNSNNVSGRLRMGKSVEIAKTNIRPFAHNGYVYCMLLTRGTAAALPYEEVLITGGGDGLVKLWSLDSKSNGRPQELAALGDEDGDPVLSIISDGTFLYSGRVDGMINVWDLETKQLLKIIGAGDTDVLALSIGRGILFSSSVDGSIASFDSRYECLDKWKAHHGRILGSCFSENEHRSALVTGANDNTIALWNTRHYSDTAAVYDQTSQEQMLDSLRQLVSYPSVSSDPHYNADCRRAASYLRGLLKRLGAATEMLKNPEGGNPVVYGLFAGHATSSQRTRIIFYGHYDVIPAGNKKGSWRTNPFALTGSDGFLYGRGATDNKGPSIAAIYAVAELVANGVLAADVIFLIEGEEESGSRGFEQTVQNNKGLIGRVDWVLLANSYWLDDEVPCLTYGLRGILRATIDIDSDEPDLHSGVDGSLLLDEPMKDLVSVVARLTGAHGRVQIPGFYDDIPPITEDELALYHDVAHLLQRRSPELGTCEELATSLRGRWREPTLTVHGFRTSGPANSTIIPRHASCVLSTRLVPNQDVDTIAHSLENFLQEEFSRSGSKNHVKVSIGHRAEPWIGDYNNKLFKTLEQAIREAWADHGMTALVSHAHQQDARPRQPEPNSFPSPTKGKRQSTSTHFKPPAPTSSRLAASLSPTSVSFPESETPSPAKIPLYIREGGSIPAVRFLEKEFGAPAAHLPCGQASDNAHLDNERIRVVNLYKAKEIFAKVFERMGS